MAQAVFIHDLLPSKLLMVRIDIILCCMQVLNTNVANEF